MAAVCLKVMGKSGKKDYAQGMQAFLRKHGDQTSHHSIKADWSRDDRTVTLNFTVQKRDSSLWQTNPAMTSDWTKNWGLWNHDVVEAFLQLRRTPDEISAPYFEIQVSPSNQPFALIITEPRKTFFPPATDLSFVTESVTEDRQWRAKLTVVLPPEIKGDYLFGGCFSCLALKDGTREFYAVQNNPEVNPDFHRPELFINLDQS